MKVLVTRPSAQADPLVAALADRGFEVVVAPLIRVEPLSDEPIDVSGARELTRRMEGRPANIAAIGPGTSAALAEAGLSPTLEAEVHTQEGLAAELVDRSGRRLFVAAEGARNLLDADFLAAYRTVELEIDELPDADLALLLSPSAARAYARAGAKPPAISIGPQTTAAARAAGIELVGEAKSHDLQGLVDCAAAWRDSSHS